MASRRLGEILIAAGLVTSEAWEEISRAEATGGRSAVLALLDRGIKPERFARVVQEAGVEFHAATRLENLSPSLLGRIPKLVAERWVALPVETRGDLLTVVMADPFEPLALQTLAEVSGARIEVGIADPRRLAQAVDRYHDTDLARGFVPPAADFPVPPPPPPGEDPIPLTLRRGSEDGGEDDIELLEPAGGELAELFGAGPGVSVDTISLVHRREADGPGPSPPPTASAVVVPSSPPVGAPPPPEALRAPPPPPTWTAAGPISPAPPEAPPPEPLTEPAPTSDLVDGPAPESAPEDPVNPLTATLARVDIQSSASGAAVADSPTDRLDTPRLDAGPDLKEDFDFAVTRLRIAETRDEIGEAAILFLARCFPRAALISVRGRTITGWLSGGDFLPEQVEVIRIEGGQPSLLWDVVDEGRPFIGPLPPGRETLSELMITPPRQLAVFPIRLGEKVVALLYGDTVDDQPILARRDLLERLSEELGDALGHLILQAKGEG